MLTLPAMAPVALVVDATSGVLPSAAGALGSSFFVGVLGLCAWLMLRLNRARQEITNTQENRAVLERLHRAHDKQVALQLEAVRVELRQAKIDLGVQRKKTHAAQQALQAGQKALRDETRRREAAQNERPAFLELPPPQLSTAAAPAPEDVPSNMAPAAAEPAAAEPAAADANLLALQAQLATLKRQHEALTEALRVAKQAGQGHRANAQRLQRRQEDLRRIDIISRSKVALLEDKLRGMGRQYYEAISELAQLKGEVAPPKPQGAAHAPSNSPGDDMTPETFDVTEDPMHGTTLLLAAEEDDDDEETNDGADAPTILDDLDSDGEADDGLPIPSDFSKPEQPGA